MRNLHLDGMRRFILVSRTGRTDGAFQSLPEAGRLDVVYQCALMSLFVSHGHREDTTFTAILGGPPRPPVAVTIDGATLHDLRTDETSWAEVLRKVLAGGTHPGFSLRRESLQQVIRTTGSAFALHEKGEPLETVELGTDPVFVLGDQVGLARADESFILRKGRQVSLGRRPSYLAASCIAAIHYILDRREAVGSTEEP